MYLALIDFCSVSENIFDTAPARAQNIAQKSNFAERNREITPGSRPFKTGE